MNCGLFLLGFSDKVEDKRNTDQTGDHICHGLGQLNAKKSQQGNPKQQHGDGHQSGADQGEEGRNRRLLNALIEHIHRNRERHEHHTDGGKTQGFGADDDNFRMLLENGNDGLCKQDADGGHGTDKYKAEGSGKQQSFFHTVNFLGLVIKGCNRLESLAHTQAYAHQEVGIAIDHAHGSNGSIAEGLGKIVQQTVCDGSQTLPDQRGETHTADLQIEFDIFGDSG